jgi:hypothetical protein
LPRVGVGGWLPNMAHSAELGWPPGKSLGCRRGRSRRREARWGPAGIPLRSQLVPRRTGSGRPVNSSNAWGTQRKRGDDVLAPSVLPLHGSTVLRAHCSGWGTSAQKGNPRCAGIRASGGAVALRKDPAAMAHARVHERGSDAELSGESFVHSCQNGECILSSAGFSGEPGESGPELEHRVDLHLLLLRPTCIRCHLPLIARAHVRLQALIKNAVEHPDGALARVAWHAYCITSTVCIASRQLWHTRGGSAEGPLYRTIRWLSGSAEAGVPGKRLQSALQVLQASIVGVVRLRHSTHVASPAVWRERH